MNRQPRQIAGAQARTALREAADRNETVELVVRELADQEGPIVRARLMEIDGNRLFIDRPAPAVMIRKDAVVSIALMHNGTRLVFEARVVDPDAILKRDGRRSISGIMLEMESAFDGQRRNAYRVEALRSENIRAILHSAMPWRNGAASLDTRPLSATILDLSMGGTGVEVEVHSGSALRINDALFFTLHLPDETDITLLVRVCQVSPTGRGQATRLGLQFAPWPSDRYLEREIQPLQRYISELQRARLRRTG